MGKTVKYAIGLDDKMSEALKALGLTAEDVDDEIKKLIAEAGGLSQAEVEVAVAVKKANSALEAKAKLLGVTVNEVKAMQAAEKRLADTQVREAKRAAEAAQKAAQQKQQAANETLQEQMRSISRLRAAEMQADAVRQQDHELRVEAEKKALNEVQSAREASAQASLQMAQNILTATTAAIVALGSLIKKIADTKNMFNDLAVESGFAAQTLQAFDLAARSGGDSLEQIAPSLKQFGKRIRDASLGVGEAKKSFDRLGISAVDLDGNMKDADTVFREITKSIQGVENSTERAAIVNDLFGESGGRLLKIFNSSADSLDAYSAKAQALGVNLNEGSAGAARLQASLADLETKLIGTGDAIVQLLGGEGGFSGLVDNFILGFTFVENIVLSLANNWMSFLKLFASNLTMIPRLIKAALAGDSIKDAFAQPFKDFADSLENPVTKAVDAVKAIVKAREELASALSGTDQGVGAGGIQLGSFTTPDKSEEVTTVEAEGGPSADDIGRQIVQSVVELQGTATSDALAEAERQFGITLEQVLERAGETQDVGNLNEIVSFLKIFEDATKEAAEAQKQAAADAAQAAKDAAIAAAESTRAAEQAKAQRQESIQTGVGAALGGPQAILSAIGSTGPQGAVIAQVAGLLEAIGSSEKGESPIDMIPKFIDAMSKGLEMLGPILVDVLPKLLTESIPTLLKALPEAMIAIVDVALPALLEALPELIEVLIVEVIPILSTYKVRIIKAIVTSVVPALLGSLRGIIQNLLNPEFWAQASKDVRREVGRALGQMVAGAGDFATGWITEIQTSLEGAFTIQFWKDVLKGIFTALTDFQFNTPGLDAFKRNAGISSGGATGLRGIAERAGDRMEGGNIIFNGLGFGDDREIATRIANIRNNRRTGARR